MQKLFSCSGHLVFLEDAVGKRPSGVWAKGRPVVADVKYELKPSPSQPLRVDISGRNLFGMGQTRERLMLDNGIVLTGRTYGGSLGGKSPKVTKIRLADLEEAKIELYPTHASAALPEIDTVVLGIVSSYPLGHGSCRNGVARPGHPFSFKPEFPRTRTTSWSSAALRLYHRCHEITVVATSRYWQKHVDPTQLHHDAIIGIRRCDRAALHWEDVHGLTSLISNFIGWINHCMAPVFHIKGYCKGKLSYKHYNLHPHPTVRRDAFSWLPSYASTSGQTLYYDSLQDLLTLFAKASTASDRSNGTFQIALDMLRSRSKGSPRLNPPLSYMRDTFSACSILVSILIGTCSTRSRRDVIWECLKEIGVEDKLPLKDQHDFDWLVTNHPTLWWGVKSQKILENEKGTLSRPLANVENWLLHMDDPKNAEMLLTLPDPVRHYLLEVSIWLADLMALRVVKYSGSYFNRLSRETEPVPWLKRQN